MRHRKNSRFSTTRGARKTVRLSWCICFLLILPRPSPNQQPYAPWTNAIKLASDVRHDTATKVGDIVTQPDWILKRSTGQCRSSGTEFNICGQWLKDIAEQGIVKKVRSSSRMRSVGVWNIFSSHVCGQLGNLTWNLAHLGITEDIWWKNNVILIYFSTYWARSSQSSGKRGGGAETDGLSFPSLLTVRTVRSPVQSIICSLTIMTSEIEHTNTPIKLRKHYFRKW